MKRVAVWGSLILALMACSRFDEQEIFETKELVFTATREVSDTKTVRVGTDVLWSPGDAISIFFRSGDNGGSKFTAQNTTENVAIAQFKGTIDVLSGGGESEDGEFWFWGIYPYSSQNSCDGSSITTVIPTQQTGKAGTFADNTFITMARSKGLNLAFYNICSGIKFNVTRSDIKEVKFRGNNSENIAGKVKVVWDSEGHPAIDEYVTGTKEVTVTAPGGGTFETGQDYYIVLAPELFSAGFTMSLVTSDSKQGIFVYENSRQFKRGIFINISDLDTRVTSWIDIAAKVVSDEGGEVELEVLSNEPCHAVIPAEAQSWISIAPETKAVTQHSIGLIIQPNTGLSRSATINVVGDDDESNVVLTYTVTQAAGGVWKEGTVPPDDEIWYTTIDGNILEPYNSNAFGARLISNTYYDGKGIMKFDGDVTMIGSKNSDMFNEPFGAPGLGTPEKLSSVFLPNTVKTIGRCAFYCCRNMNQIGMPNELECIGSDAFLDCESLVRIEIPISVTEIGVAAFGDCPNLSSFDGDCMLISADRKCIVINGALVAFASFGTTTYNIPEGIIDIPAYTFLRSSIETISFPSSLVSIGNMAFDFSKLKEVTLNEGLKTIAHAAFRGCPLRTVHIPSTVEIIEDEAFSCDEMERYTGKFASTDGKCLIVDGRIISFAYKGLTSYSLPPETKIVGSNLFNSPLLEHITIPEGVERIGGNAFTCRNLKTINIPSTVDAIGDAYCGPFSYCVNLESITGKYSTEDHRCLIKDNRLISFAPKGLTNYSIPEGVVSIGPSAFEEHPLTNISLPSTLTQFEDRAFRSSGLTSVTIPESVSYIGDQAFFDCDDLKEVYVRSSIPPVFGWQESYNPGDIFDIADDGTIYVPSQSLQLYKNTWVTYAGRIVGYDYSDLQLPDYYISTDYTADGIISSLQQSSTGAGIDLILMGDAFSDRQIADGTYGTIMQKAMNAFFSEEPYKSMKDRFNVYTVNVVSATEGYEHIGQALSTGHGAGTYVYGNDSKVIEYAKKAVSEDRLDDALIIVMMNEDAYAGTCFMYNPPSGNYGRGLSIAYFPTSSDTDTFNGLVSHEAGGHGFAKLADEYAYEYMGAISDDEIASTRVNEPYGWWKNVDFTSDPVLVKWSQFLADDRYANEGLGCYEGGLTYWSGVWRPTDASIMRYNTGGFNAPSRYAIWYRIGKLAYGENWEGSYEDFVTYDAVNRTPAAIQRRNAQRRNYVEKPLPQLPAPVVVGHSWREELEKGR